MFVKGQKPFPKKERGSKILTPVKAIRAYCIDCCCGSFNEVQLCPSKKCSLYPYRLGHRPPKDFDQTSGPLTN
jgi:hypothetical protein